MYKKLILYFIALLSVGLVTSPTASAEKSYKNTKKADVKKISREEHLIVKNWANLHKKTADKKKKIKKQFQ